MSRIVSLIASSTEMVWALGQGHRMVARSHECDYPAEVLALPVVTEPKLRIEMDRETGLVPTSADIDAQVHALVREALAVYRVDVAALEAVQPTLIITQTQCEVCAVSLRDVEQAVLKLVSSRPRIVALEPNSLEDIFLDLRKVAAALGVREAGDLLEQTLRHRMQSISIHAAARRGSAARPTVACIEWIEPLMSAGNWMPTLVELAGGESLLGQAGKHSPYMTFDQLVAADPDVILIVPCGFGIPRTKSELGPLASHPAWQKLRAVRDERVYLADGHQYFNRPGPRIVESLEILVEILHDDDGIGARHEGSGWEHWPTGSSARMRAGGGPVLRGSRGSTMGLEEIRVSAVISASPTRLYDAWIDAVEHGEMTDTQATIEPHVGGRHTAADGYIEGTILELEPGRRVVQSWRSLDFPQGSVESRLEVLFRAVAGGTEVTLVHTDIPDGQGADYEAGWVEHYFKPMQTYFAGPAAPLAPTLKRKAPAKQKPAPKKAAAPKKKKSTKKPVAKKQARPHKKARR
ncbi:MAG: SRPBCC domain-containing protein [Polyangia bacterium]